MNVCNIFILKVFSICIDVSLSKRKSSLHFSISNTVVSGKGGIISRFFLLSGYTTSRNECDYTNKCAITSLQRQFLFLNNLLFILKNIFRYVNL